ncbi:TetR/AcrR family transcriptional regulator [Salinimicrobium oceani]|uniref:TetR/AcrR family transcriptional regulator n=1 Tax=Salinimicrobium oceani TaxID=2722702 RepID=A0ABX1CWY1_9FLAO|nr:TetR/AcrR family transcriptional regulator [Salinimicrobium oceani]NJW52282.1 TetR/AcrR family transcriptional regulator [Salinimicrobium oceani]
MKEQLLSKAAEMFLTLGVKSVTMDEIAAEMGISKKTIYAHFPTKTKLIEATALSFFETISAGIQEIRNEDNDAIEELFQIKEFACQNLKDEKSSPQYQLQKYYPKIYATIKDKQKHVLEELTTENLEKGIAKGIYRKDLPVRFLTRIYFIGILGIKDREIFGEEEFTTKELTNMHLEYHLRAIVTPKGLEKLETLLKSQDKI